MLIKFHDTIADLFNLSLLAGEIPYPMTETEAQTTLDAWKDENSELWKDFQDIPASEFSRQWNLLLNDTITLDD